MNLADLHNEVLLDCPSVPPPLLEDAAYRAAWHFCHTARLWRETLAPLALVAGQAAYPLTGPAGTQVLGVVRCKDRLSGLPLTPKTELELDTEFPGWEDIRATGPSMFFQPSGNVLRLVYTPDQDQADAMDVRVFLAPATAATVLPDETFLEHRDALIAGARGRLQRMPGRPWSNPDQALLNTAIFEQAAHDARRSAFKSGTRGPSVMHGTEFGF